MRVLQQAQQCRQAPDRVQICCSAQHVSGLAGQNYSVDNVLRCMQDGPCWKGLHTKQAARQQLYESGVSMLLELDQRAS